MKTPTIRQESGKTWIENVPALAWGRNRECAFLGALEAALAPTARPFMYDELMGWSGLAFRIRWYQGAVGPHWSPSGAIGEFPDELAALRRATGWELHSQFFADHAPGHLAPYASNIAHSIRAGRPVLAYDSQSTMGVIYGFEDEGRTVLFRDYYRGDEPLRLKVAKLGPMIVFLGESHAGLSLHGAAAAGIELGVQHWHEGFEGSPTGRYWHGRAALLKWSEDLAHADRLSRDDRKQLFHVNWWTFATLLDARTAAGRFLHDAAFLFSGSPRRHLLDASSAYAEEEKLLRAAHEESTMFFGPWSETTIADWTKTVRDCERALLHRCLELEAGAIGELENFIEAVNSRTMADEMSGSH